MKTINSITLLILITVCVLAQVIVVTVLCEITWPPLIHVLFGVFVVNVASTWIINRRRRERKRIKKTYMVGDKVSVRKMTISRKFPFLLKRPVECVVTEDYKLIPTQP